MRADFPSGSATEILARQVCEELRNRLRAGDPCEAESYLSAYPALASDPDWAVEIIVTEFVVRRELGQHPHKDDWYARFPQLSDQLRRAFETHAEAEEAAQDASTETPTAALTETNPSIVLDGLIPQLGQHELLEELGHGAMGVVYRARDKVLDREVALKMIKPGLLGGTEAVQRFYKEARTAARLRHPNIVPIHGMGLHEGQHCFTMPLFTGGSLAQNLGRYTNNPHAAVALVVKIARAMHALHLAGIIHRDLKPANIFLDGEPGVPVEQLEPLVGDFGLAKSNDRSADLSGLGQVIGTPAYMSPEQAAGHTWAISERSDVWALGVILFELLTGHRPFHGDAEAITRKVLEEEPSRPCAVWPGLPPDLERIVLRCLEKQSQHRYPTAEALADDLQRWQRGEPLPHPPPPPRAPRRSWFRRHRVECLIALVLAAFATAAPLLSRKKVEDPEQLYQERLRDLQEGRPMTLLAETGAPLKWAWVDLKGEAEPGNLPTINDEPGVFTLSSMDRARLELLSDPQWTNYRLSGQVNHRDTGGGSRVGLYCLSFRGTVPEESAFASYDLTFNDRDAGANRNVSTKLYGSPNKTWGPTPPQKIPGDPVPLAQKNVWRDLVIEVSPQAILAFFDGGLVWQLKRKDFPAFMEPHAFKGKHPALAEGAFNTRGGLGLYVYRGTASFRNLKLEPLNVENEAGKPNKP
jgi:serine/threonine-protein kinase